MGALLVSALPLRRRSGSVAVTYGGAFGGSSGGPLVKVSLLSRKFPNHTLGYSILYVLSNAIYLPGTAIGVIKAAGVPIVLNQNGVYYRAWYDGDWQRENARIAYLHAMATHVVYQSEFCRRCALQFLGARKEGSEILYNAVDTDAFTPSDVPEGDRPFTFLLTGKITAPTGYRLMASIAGLAAARRNGLEVRLLVAGAIDADVERKARAWADRHAVSDAISWLGPYRHTDAPQVYRAADAYLMLKHNDPCPNVVLEALASGLPVLYSASGGVPELVGSDAGVGLPVPDTFEDNPVPDPDAIAEGMAKILAQRDSMGRAARARAVARFDLKSWLIRHEVLFRQLVGTVQPAKAMHR
jgi:glycosyltransferase involved in cell wall biosynthesis